jgi:hypothetical protein
VYSTPIQRQAHGKENSFECALKPIAHQHKTTTRINTMLFMACLSRHGKIQFQKITPIANQSPTKTTTRINTMSFMACLSRQSKFNSKKINPTDKTLFNLSNKNNTRYSTIDILNEHFSSRNNHFLHFIFHHSHSHSHSHNYKNDTIVNCTQHTTNQYSS